MANYKVNHKTQEIRANLEKCTEEERKLVKDFQDMGYKYKHLRDSSSKQSRKKTYYEDKLSPADYKTFEKMCKEKGKGKGYFAAKTWADKRINDDATATTDKA